VNTCRQRITGATSGLTAASKLAEDQIRQSSPYGAFTSAIV
jgi:hypothetical protein